MPAAYPTRNDLTNLLDDLKLPCPNPLRLDNLVNQAWQRFERETGWTPFLASNSPSTRVFDPPGQTGKYVAWPKGGGRMLALDAGLISTSSLSVDGNSAFVQGTDYWLRPAQGPAPATRIEFAAPIWANTYSVSITGIWGYSTAVPDDAWYCILRMAALPLLSEA